MWENEDEGDTTLQDVHQSSFYCDRRDGMLCRSDWFEGSHILDLQDQFFGDSLKVEKGPSPLTSCTVHIHAYWIQREEGAENLSSSIRLVFPHGQVNTYTPDSLLNHWPTTGQHLGRSGLWILKSDLGEISPSTAGSYSPPVLLTKKEEHPQPYRVKRYWFKPTLWIGWSYQQRRKETLCFTLDHVFHDLFSGEGEHKEIEFTLQNINPEPQSYPWHPLAFYKEGAKVFYKNATYRCITTHTAGLSFEDEKWEFRKFFYTPLGDPARSSFFLTERGYQATEHAMERAKALLAKSARALFITLESSWEILQNVTTDTTIILSDPRLPGGKAKGKVLHYSLIAKGDTGERYGRVTLACSIGCGRTPPYTQQQPPPASYYDEDYCAHDPFRRRTPSDLEYFRYDTHSPPRGHKEGRLLKGINLVNGPDIQESTLLGCEGATPAELKKTLSSFSTRLCLYFKDLRTKETLEHIIPVTLSSAWTAPKQIGGGGD